MPRGIEAPTQRDTLRACRPQARATRTTKGPTPLPTPSSASLRLLLRFALDGLRGQRGRSLLTLLGMAIGTASVLALISIGLVGRDYVVSLIEGVGTNLVIVYSTDEGSNPEQVTFGDLEAIEERVPYVAAMAPVLSDFTPHC